MRQGEARSKATKKAGVPRFLCAQAAQKAADAHHGRFEVRPANAPADPLPSARR